MNQDDEHKRSQILVLDALNETFEDAGTDDDEKRAIAVATVLIYSDGTVDSKVSGELNRQLMIGALQDLILQVFHECKQREINEMVERTVRDLHLASMPTGPKPN